MTNRSYSPAGALRKFECTEDWQFFFVSSLKALPPHPLTPSPFHSLNPLPPHPFTIPPPSLTDPLTPSKAHPSPTRSPLALLDVHLLRLPADVLGHILGFVQSRALVQCCQTTWAHLQGRHVELRTGSPMRIADAILTWQATMLSFWLDTRDKEDDDDFSSAVAMTPKMRLRAARVLGVLKEAPALQVLHLDLRGNDLGHKGAEAIAALKDAPGHCRSPYKSPGHSHA